MAEPGLWGQLPGLNPAVWWGQHSTISSPRRVRGYLSTVLAAAADHNCYECHTRLCHDWVCADGHTCRLETGGRGPGDRAGPYWQDSSRLCWGRFCGHCQEVHGSSKLDEFSRAPSPEAGPKAGNNNRQHPETASRPAASILPGLLMSGERPRLQAFHVRFAF